MKCKYCKCTTDQACPEGCSWVLVGTVGHGPSNKQTFLPLPVCTSCVPIEIQDLLLKIGKTTSCDRMRANACSRPATAKTLTRIGPRWYLVRECTTHGRSQERIQELKPYQPKK